MKHRESLQSSLAALVLWLGALPAAMAQVEEGTTLFANPYPESGRWFANDGSRTGLFIEVQDGVLAGLYVGADNSGDDVCLTFNGQPAGGQTSTGGPGQARGAVLSEASDHWVWNDAAVADSRIRSSR